MGVLRKAVGRAPREVWHTTAGSSGTVSFCGWQWERSTQVLQHSTNDASSCIVGARIGRFAGACSNTPTCRGVDQCMQLATPWDDVKLACNVM